MTTDIEKQEHQEIGESGSGTESGPRQCNEKSVTEDTVALIDVENNQAYKGDDSDGKIAWSGKKLMAAIFLSMLYTGSQLPLYFTGGALYFIAQDIGSPSIIAWIPVSLTLAVAAICPFVGYLQDIFGKRYIALMGSVLICIGCIVLGTAHSLGPALAGMVLCGAGASIGELTGIAGLAELVPVKHRGYSIAALTAFIIPFIPYVMYCELFSTRGPHPTWRWGAWISLIYNGVALVGLATFYFPHNHVLTEHRMAILKRIDYVGAFLSIIGLTLFLVALQAGGYSHPWESAYVLCSLIIGLILLCVWVVWEWRFARSFGMRPMIPHELFQGQRVVAVSFFVAFIGGFNFFSLLNFWPLTITTVWGASSPTLIGWRGLAFALGFVTGVIFWTALLSLWRGSARWILALSSAFLALFGGSLATMTPHNPTQTTILAAFAAFGLGGIITPAATVAIIACPDALITSCTALSLSVRAVGGSIGYSIYYSIFTKRLTTLLPLLVGQYAIDAGLAPSRVQMFVEILLTAPENLASAVPGVTPAIVAAAQLGAQWAYAEALHLVWYATIAFSVLAMGAALAVPNTRRFETNRIAVEL